MADAHFPVTKPGDNTTMHQKPIHHDPNGLYIEMMVFMLTDLTETGTAFQTIKKISFCIRQILQFSLWITMQITTVFGMLRMMI
jgi:hypothetical protein